MSNPLTLKSWSPYVVGAGIGLLSWFSFATVDRPLGITTAFENTAALIGKSIARDQVRDHAYYANPEHRVRLDWEWMLVLGVAIGALVSSAISGDRETRTVPGLWQWRFGPSAAARLLAAFAGGALMMFGARLADGCTSGHGISGALQLAVSSWLFTGLLFLSGIMTAMLLYGREGRRHV